MRYILRPAVTLFITAAVVVALLSFVHTYTLEPIEKQKFKKQEAAMKVIMPRAAEFKEIHVEKTGSITGVYEAIYSSDVLDDKVLVGYIVQLSPEGYSGKIDLIVGISSSENIIKGIRVLNQTETPGLGANSVKEKFYSQYNNRDITPLGVVRNSPGEHDIQAITSSTITTRAITNAVNEAIEWYLGITGEKNEVF
ncbi:MAG: RnfABCDGE type electron transport complex subunit G [Treponema sp.]|nr:RnfABCDGE type electron transport complex subunit G [Treponema sp.]